MNYPITFPNAFLGASGIGSDTSLNDGNFIIITINPDYRLNKSQTHLVAAFHGMLYPFPIYAIFIGY